MLIILPLGNDFFVPVTVPRDDPELAGGGAPRPSLATTMTEVQCPTCFEVFQVPAPPSDECPCELDYDCEICCRPMVIVFEEDGVAWARGLGDL